MRTVNWKATLIRLFLLAWGVQVLWLGWHFSSEAQDLARRLLQGNTGDTVRQEDPFYRWLMTLSKVMPPQAAYVFLDAATKKGKRSRPAITSTPGGTSWARRTSPPAISIMPCARAGPHFS